VLILCQAPNHYDRVVQNYRFTVHVQKIHYL